MKTPLIPKGSNFNQNYEMLVLKIQSIRKKNDQYQILSAQQLDSAMAQEVIQQKQIMDKQIVDTKKMIEEMQQVFKQLPQKNKLKDVRKEYEKQLSRYKQVSQALMEKSVIKAQMRDSYRKSLPNKANQQRREDMREVRPPRQSAQIAKQQQLDIDYDMQHDVLMNRKKQLGNVQQHMQRVYQLHLDQQNMVHDQGQMVDIIGQQMLKAHQNVENTNEQLTQARIQQKKGRKKCYFIIFGILFILLLGGGILYFSQPPK